MSPDGNDVYVASRTDHAVVHWNRNPTTGALTFVGCVEDTAASETCTQSSEGLAGATSVAVSPDGESLYVAASLDDAVVLIDRNPATGNLSPAAAADQCVDDNDTGVDACVLNENGLDRPEAVVATNSSVYVASLGDDAVVRLDRNVGTGVLTPQGCIDDDDTGADGCGQTTDALGDAMGLALSPDGVYLYASSDTDDAVVRFTRNVSTGALAPAGCSGTMPPLAPSRPARAPPMGSMGPGASRSARAEDRCTSPRPSATRWRSSSATSRPASSRFKGASRTTTPASWRALRTPTGCSTP